jgi:hypothetical protein
MTTHEYRQIETEENHRERHQAVGWWAGRRELPEHLRNPQNEYDFAIAMAVALHDQHPEVTPTYNSFGNLTGWRGIELRDLNF